MAIFKSKHTEKETVSPPSDPETNDLEASKEVQGTQLTPELSYSQTEHLPWTFKRVVAIISLCLVYVGSQTVLYFVSSGLSFIAVSLDTDVVNWLVTANTLAVAAICPFVGYLTDVLGRRWITIGGTILLIIASALQGAAPNLGAAIVAQTFGGIGAGICELNALAGVAEITPARWRGVALSVVTFSIVPFMPQLLYSLLINEASTWRWTFMIAGGWNFIGLIGLFFAYHPPPRPNPENLTTRQILARIDYFGAFIVIAGVTLFLVGLQAGGYQYPWRSAKVLAPLIIGLIVLFLFPVWEYYGAKNPIVPRAVFQGQYVVAIAYVLVFVAGMNFYSILGFFPVLLEDVYNTSLVETGLRGLTYPFAILSGACIVSALMSYTKGHVRPLFLACALIQTAFTGALAVANPYNPSTTLGIGFMATFGNGAVVVPALTLALYACPDRYIGTTAALSLAVRFLGGAVGTTIYFNIFNTKITDSLPTYIATAAVEAGLPQGQAMAFVEALVGGSMSAVEAIPGVTPAVLAAAQLGKQMAFAYSLSYVWYTTIAFGGLSIICCLFLPNIRKYMTNRVAVDIH